jgi:purine-binding chemotaxis protein CheW
MSDGDKKEDRLKLDTDNIISEWKRRRGQADIMDVEEEKVQLIIFSLLKDYYAFYGSDVKEILPVGGIAYVPGSPDFILGIINLRGDIESVLDIYKFMGIPDTKPTSKSRIIIAVKDDIRSGILVDSVEDVMDIPISSIKPPISTLTDSVKEFVLGETTYNNMNVTLLNVGKIFKKITV